MEIEKQLEMLGNKVIALASTVEILSEEVEKLKESQDSNDDPKEKKSAKASDEELDKAMRGLV